MRMPSEARAYTLSNHQVLRFALLDSTNTRLKLMAREGAADGLVVIADAQSDGHGRAGRKWIAPSGAGAWFSLLMKPSGESVPARRAADLVFVCALSMTRALRALSKCEVLIKWPNDLVANGKKLSGMMCQMQSNEDTLEWAVLGIGVNLLGAQFESALTWATSVESETGEILDSDALIERFLNEFDELYALWRARGLGDILKLIAPLSATLGKRVRARSATDESAPDIEGMAERFEPDGALTIIKDDGARVTVYAGDVSVRGVMGYA